MSVFLIASVCLVACSSDEYPKNEWVASTCSADDTFGVGSSKGRQASAMLEDALAIDHGVGFSAAVMIDGELVWSKAAGKAVRRKNGELTTKARMRLGSLAKPFTAVLAAKLYEDGVIDIDAPIQEYVPSFPEKDGVITIRNLANHSSGIRQYDFSNLKESNSDIQYDDLEDALFVFADDPLVSAPGEAVLYTSLGYNLIGAAIENAYGGTFDEAMKVLITEPLNLTGTTVDDPTQFTPCRPKFYTIAFGRFPIKTIWRNQSDSYSSAGMLSTAVDINEFTNHVFSGDFLSLETQELIKNQGVLNDGTKTNRTFGWEVKLDENGEVEWYGHGGVTNGAHASVRYYPKSNMVVAGIINYNFWLTDRYPQFFQAIREDIPALFEESEK